MPRSQVRNLLITDNTKIGRIETYPMMMTGPLLLEPYSPFVYDGVTRILINSFTAFRINLIRFLYQNLNKK